MIHWESLIAQRSRPCATMPEFSDPVEQNAKMNKRRLDRIRRANWTPEQRAHRNQLEKARRDRRTPEQREHDNMMKREWNRAHPERERTPERIAKHKAWAKSPSGKESMRRRTAKYYATEKGKANARKKSMAFYNRHKDEPEFKARRKEYQRTFRERHKVGKLRVVEYSITLHDIGQMTVHIATTKAA